LWVIAGTLLFAVLYSIYILLGFFFPHKSNKEQSKEVASVGHAPTGQALPNSPKGTTPTGTTPNPSRPNFSTTYRIKGFLELSTRRYVVLEDTNNNQRLINPSFCNSRGLDMICDVDNEKVTYYTGTITKNGANNDDKRITK